MPCVRGIIHSLVFRDINDLLDILESVLPDDQIPYADGQDLEGTQVILNHLARCARSLKDL